MAEYLTRNLKMLISTTPETTFNAIKITNGDTYLGMLTTGRAFYIPDKEKVDDTGKIGTGREFPTEQRSTYVSVPSIEITEEANIDMAALLLRRAMGGTDVVGAATGVTGTHTINDHVWGLDLSTTTRQLPSSSMIWALGGADYVWGGVVVESYTISQTNSDVPTISVSMVGSGLHKRISYLTGNGNIQSNTVGGSGGNPYTGPYAGALNSQYPPSFPFPTTQRYMIGAESEVTFSAQNSFVLTITSATVTAGDVYTNLANGVTYTVAASTTGTTVMAYGTATSAAGTLTKVSGASGSAATLTLSAVSSSAISFTTYTFTVTSASATAGAVYENNGEYFTVTSTISGATSLVTTGTGAPISGTTTLYKVNGTGDATISASAVVASSNATPYSLTASGQRLKAISLTLTNNNRTDDRRPGDSRVVSTNPRQGHYIGRLNHGDRTIAAEMTVMLDDNLNEFFLAFNDTIIEAFTYTMKGRLLPLTSGADSTAQAEFEITFPKCYFRGVRGTDDSGDAVLTISIFPVDNGTTGPMIARVRNTSSSPIV